MKITITIDVFGELETAREHRAEIRQAVCAVLADQITHDRETVGEPIETSGRVQIAEINCHSVYAGAAP